MNHDNPPFALPNGQVLTMSCLNLTPPTPTPTPLLHQVYSKHFIQRRQESTSEELSQPAHRPKGIALLLAFRQKERKRSLDDGALPPGGFVRVAKAKTDHERVQAESLPGVIPVPQFRCPITNQSFQVENEAKQVYIV
jgi:hypothetical protein